MVYFYMSIFLVYVIANRILEVVVTLEIPSPLPFVVFLPFINEEMPPRDVKKFTEVTQLVRSRAGTRT